MVQPPHFTKSPYGPLWPNVTSSIKPEVALAKDGHATKDTRARLAMGKTLLEEKKKNVQGN